MSNRLSTLRDDLLDLQFRLRHADQTALALIVTGVPAAGRSETINELLSWLDPKYIRVHAFGAADLAERRMPSMWRYWKRLPPRGRMAFYFAGWYADLAPTTKVGGQAPSNKRALARIRQLERMLVADGVGVLKVHLHVDRATQSKRIAQLRANKLTSWRVTGEDLRFAKHYGASARVISRTIRATEQAAAPWHVVDGHDAEQRMIDIGALLRNALRQALRPSDKSKGAPKRILARGAGPRAKITATSLDDKVYETELASLQGRLARAVRAKRFEKRGLVLAFEGIDAAGKGGAIRRITQALDARQYQVIPVSAPSSEEAAHPYLWRFWKHVPERGDIAIFDRSWYGRVLVERVRRFTSERDWRRAYEEINEFERQLTEHGLIVAKFWLQVSKEEQLKRFRAREQDPLKRFKVDEEDWVNRRHFDAYQAAAADMVRLTNQRDAPWFVIDADEKKHARLEVLRAVCATLNV